jgi:hypothetical protein
MFNGPKVVLIQSAKFPIKRHSNLGTFIKLLTFSMQKSLTKSQHFLYVVFVWFFCASPLYKLAYTIFKSSPNCLINWRHVTEPIHVFLPLPKVAHWVYKIGETNGLKIWCNLKTQWINMPSISLSTKHFLSRCNKMLISVKEKIATVNYDHVTNIQFFDWVWNFCYSCWGLFTP